MKAVIMYIKKYLLITVLFWLISSMLIIPKFHEDLPEKIALSILIFYTIFFIIIMINESFVKKLKIVLNRKSKILKIKYEREIINDYSPLICAKLLGKDIHDPDVITAMILYLKEKKLTIINNDGKLLLDLRRKRLKHEEFFIQESDVIFYDLYNWTKKKTKYNSQFTYIQYLEKLVCEDMLELGLIQEMDKESHLANDFYAILPFVYSLFNMLNIASLTLIKNHTSFIIISTIILIANIIYVILFFIEELYKTSFQILKTEKAHLYTTKLNAQKRFLKEYSMISSRTIQEKVLWEHYIKMAVLFDLKGKLDGDSMEYYIKSIKIYGYKPKEKVNIEKTLIYVCGWIWSASMALPYIKMWLTSEGLDKLLFSQAFLLGPLAFLCWMRTKYIYKK